MRNRLALAGCVAFVAIGGIGALASAQDSSDDSGAEFTQPAMPTLPDGVKDADDLPDAQRVAFEDALLESAKPAPDVDGDPTTIEGVLPDGRETVVTIQTAVPEQFQGIDIDEFAAGEPGRE